MDVLNRIIESESSKIILPALLTIVLFAVAIFGVTLPTLRNNLFEQKKMQITVLTQSAWNVLEHYDNEVSSGNMSLDMAQELAQEQIRGLRFGPEGKDYFWINDFHPFMVMHPYLPQLEGQDLSTFTDRNGKFLFKEFVNKVLKEGAGFVPYLWQWNDSPARISPKLSYVKSFESWGWIIGTGLYLDDVNDEIANVSRKIVYFSIAILAIIIILLARIIHQSKKEIRNRQIAETKIRNYQGKLERLVEERTAKLQKTLDEVKTLRGILPLCSFCKKIRDDQGYWEQVDVYIHKHLSADISHSICPECANKKYPEFCESIHPDKNQK